jgi:NAD(P)-dependent dehydrogenase (short-subunit alcohol dehydrogenase family)
MIERGGGKIVNFASTDGMVGVPEQSAYCASKGAVVQLTRTLGAEWIKHGVNVNAVGPCDFDTPMIAEALGEPEYRAWILDAIPAGRMGKLTRSSTPCCTSRRRRRTWSSATR